MSEAIISALITGTMALIGVIITSMMTSKKTEQQINVNQAVMNEKIETLTREVREHNNFAKRMPVVEQEIKVINHRIDDLEGFHKPKN